MATGNRTHQRPDGQRPGQDQKIVEREKSGTQRKIERDDRQGAIHRNEDRGEAKPGTPGVKGE